MKVTQQERIQLIMAQVVEPILEVYKGITIITGSNSKGSPVLCIFKGAANKPYCYYNFSSFGRMIEYLTKEKNAADELEAKQTALKEAKQTYKAKNHFNLGDILVTSWGYEQTNREFYQVVGYFGETGLITKELRKEYIEDGFMSGKSSGIKDDFRSEQETRFRTKLVTWSKDPAIICASYMSMGKWDGQPVYESHYA